jgi:hypothetical protein
MRSKRKHSSVRTAAAEVGEADTSKHHMSKHRTAVVAEDTSKHHMEEVPGITNGSTTIGTLSGR